jgi:hypothetical protein
LQAKVKTREQTAVRTLSSRTARRRASFRSRRPTFCKHAHGRRAGAVPSAARILIQLLVNARGLLSSDTNTLAREHLHSRAGARETLKALLQCNFASAELLNKSVLFETHNARAARAFHFNSREISSRTAPTLYFNYMEWLARISTPPTWNWIS